MTTTTDQTPGILTPQTVNVTAELLAEIPDPWAAMEAALKAVLVDGAAINLFSVCVSVFADTHDDGEAYELPTAAREWLALVQTIDADEVDPICFRVPLPVRLLRRRVRLAA